MLKFYLKVKCTSSYLFLENLYSDERKEKKQLNDNIKIINRVINIENDNEKKLLTQKLIDYVITFISMAKKEVDREYDFYKKEKRWFDCIRRSKLNTPEERDKAIDHQIELCGELGNIGLKYIEYHRKLQDYLSITSSSITKEELTRRISYFEERASYIKEINDNDIQYNYRNNIKTKID